MCFVLVGEVMGVLDKVLALLLDIRDVEAVLDILPLLKEYLLCQETVLK